MYIYGRNSKKSREFHVGQKRQAERMEINEKMVTRMENSQNPSGHHERLIK